MSKTKYYAEIFAKSGLSYHRAMQLCPAARDAEFLAVASLLDLNPGQALLDVPAGGGYLKNYLPDHIGYTALDFAGTFHDSGEQNDVAKCVETNLNCAAERFDYVVCLAALHHVGDRLGFFAELKRVLKPGGVCLLGDVLSGSPPATFLNGFVDQWNSLGHEGDFMQGTRERHELESLGFKVELTSRHYCWRFTDIATTMHYMRLLFNLDLAPNQPELHEALIKLGFSEQRSGCLLPWSLTFIKASL